jgi:hypothetical protein
MLVEHRAYLFMSIYQCRHAHGAKIIVKACMLTPRVCLKHSFCFWRILMHVCTRYVRLCVDDYC